MKIIITLSFSILLAAPTAWSNGESLTLREQAQGTAEIDEEYVDELKIRDAALEKKTQAEKTRERMEDNPRNPAMVESFEEVSDKEAQKVKQKQERREGEAQGQDYDNPRVWR